MMKFIYPNTRESGVVSILSVIFFIILMSVISVSFLRLVTDEQEQVIEDDLSKGALAAARSGVEDTKRALLYCQANPSDVSCANLDNQSCPGIFADAGLLNDLGLNANRQADGSIRVGDPTNNSNQRYTCVTLSQDTPNYLGTLSDGLGDFIPLRSTAPFNQIRISWQQTGVDAPVAIPPAANSISLNTNPRRPQWQNGAGLSYVAMPRLQLMDFDSNKLLSAQSDNSVGTFLVPSTGGTQTLNVSSISANDPGNMQKRTTVKCNTGSPATLSGYLCTATLKLNFAMSPTAQYFMLLKSQYGSAHYEVDLLNNGSPVNFNNVQPQVDSTGVAGDVYKRILSRVAYQANTFFTSNSIESGASICKDFVVTVQGFDNTCADLLGTSTGEPPSSTGAIAGIGSSCQIYVCTQGNNNGGSITWSQPLVNLSANADSDVKDCKWDFQDGTTSTTNCHYGDTFTHTFPSNPAYVRGTNLPKINYDVTLTIDLWSGRSATAHYPLSLPKNYP